MKTSIDRHWITWCGAAVLAFLVAGCPPTPPSTEPTPSPVPTEMGVTVKLAEHTGCDPEKPGMSATGGTDHIRWINETGEERKLHFTVDWPFLEASADIVIAAGATSPWYTLDPSKVSGGGRPFPYDVIAPLTTSGDVPDEPSISGEP